MSDTKPIQMSAEEAVLHAEYRRLLMVREDERDHARIAEVRAAIDAFHPSMRPLDEEEIDRRIADRKARKRLEQLRNLPLVTAADRERYAQWEQEARAALAEVEPPSARIERAYSRAAMRRNEWRTHWRSLPDYDGPPMRSPSGVYWVGGWSPSLVPIVPVHYSTRWSDHLKGLDPRVLPDVHRQVGDFVRTATWFEEHLTTIEFAFPSDKRFIPPSKGGRGWCPKLAGVGE